MRKKLLFLFILLGLSTFTKGQTIMDTTSIISKTDTAASLELKNYDAASGRQTGVPIDLQHYDRMISYSHDKTKLYVSYVFNKTKFYGASGSDIKLKDEDKFPYHFGVMLDLNSHQTSIFK